MGLLLLSLLASASQAVAREWLLNVSYDATRELYLEVNAAFSADWKARTGSEVKVLQSHGGSAKQARAVFDGLRADVVTLALGYDIGILARRAQLLPADWQETLERNSCPCTSTVVFLVRGGNPKGIRDWPDLAREGVRVITPNPKTSGGARWNYLAAYGWALRTNSGDPQAAREFIKRLLANVPMLNTGSRAARTTFIKRGIGDVLIGWESEALTALAETGAGEYEVIYPSMSIVAEPPVAVVERNARRNGTMELAQAYVAFLYSPAAQEILARHHFRTASNAGEFPDMELFTLAELFGSWPEAHAAHFAKGALFDQIYEELFR